MGTIKTLSLSGYIARENKNGYAVALCLPEVEGEPIKVLEEYCDGSNFPEGTTVNVATGVIIRPAFLKGVSCLIHNHGFLFDMKDSYTRVYIYQQMLTWEANKYYSAETSPLTHTHERIQTGA